MITLAAGDTLAAGASVASQLTSTVFGMELSGSTEVYKVLDQRQLAATPATIYTAPGGNSAHIRTIKVVNNDTASRTFQYFRGGTAAANAITPPFILKPSYQAVYEDGTGWRFTSDTGELQTAFGPYIQLQNYGIDGSLAETFDRNFVTETNHAILTSQRLQVQAIWLTSGMLISNISFFSATTALAGGSNQLFGLYDMERALLAQSVNDGATAWAANTIKTLALSSPATFKVQYTGLYYLACMVHATTTPTLKGNTAPAAIQLHNETPVLQGFSTTGLTTSLPNPAAAITGATTNMWGAVS